MTEAELIQQSCAGSIDAFEQLILLYEKRVYTIAYKYMGNHEDANDMAQEALIKAYQSIGSFRGEAAFGTWLGKITANRCLDELRKRKKLQTTSLEDTLELEEGSVKKELESPAVTPEEHAVQQETAAYMQMLIGELKEEYRVAIVLREMDGYSYEAIADSLSCSVGTVKSRISRARQYLRERILADRMLEKCKERSETDDNT
jgi:RNA polymerase sigma-70 factor (ECF subfamily)